MRLIRAVLAVAALVALSACSTSKFRSYNGPEVTRVVVTKSDRSMHLLHHDEVLASYRVALGFDPVGHKKFEGDGRTPEGEYIIDRRNPNSAFHLSLGISYPNEQDAWYAGSNGKSAGGDIFIHGRGPHHRRARGDWTAGCIAVNDRQMERIYAMINKGTPITILP